MKFSCEVRFVNGGKCVFEGKCMEDVRGFLKKVMERKCEVSVFVDEKEVFVFYEMGVCGVDKCVVLGVWEKVNVGVIKEFVVDRVERESEYVRMEDVMLRYWLE